MGTTLNKMAKEKRCKHCKWYRPEVETVKSSDDSFQQDVNLGWGNCQNENYFIYESTSVFKNNKAACVYYDYEGYQAGFYVGSEFGCVHFEQSNKEEKQPDDEMERLEKETSFHEVDCQCEGCARLYKLRHKK